MAMGRIKLFLFDSVIHPTHCHRYMNSLCEVFLLTAML